MAKLEEVFEKNKEQLDESLVQILKNLPLGLKVELSIIGITLLSGFIKSTVKKYRTKRNGSEYKVYSFNFGKLAPEETADIINFLKEITSIIKKNSEVIDSVYKVKEHGGNVHAAIINLLIKGYNERKYESLIKNSTISKILNFEKAEVETGNVYDSDGYEVDDNRLTEGLVQLLWPILKTVAAVYTGKVIFDKISDMIQQSNIEYGKYVTYGWEFESSDVSISKVEKLMNGISYEIQYNDRTDIIKDVSINVFRQRDKIVAYLMLSVVDYGDIRKSERILDRVSKKFDIEFVEIKRGSI